MRIAFAGLVAIVLASGCFSGPPPAPEPTGTIGKAGLSEPAFAILKGVSTWIAASSDGTELHTRLFQPDTAPRPDWKAPTILVASPYFGSDARADPMDASSAPDYFRYQWLINHFVPRGYTLAFLDVRGTGDSGGCLEQTAQLQWQDAYDVVEALAAQPGSNGRVGMFGKSYDAETQTSAAVMAPPHLTTIVPVAAVSGQYEYSFYDGVPFTGQAMLSNVLYAGGDGLQPPTTAQGLRQFPTRVGCHAEMLAKGADMDGDWDQFWEDREIRHHAHKIKASVLTVHGLQDWNVKPVAIRDWFDLIPSEKRAIYGQWAHDYPEQNNFKPEWSRQDWRDTVHRWYDHWLLGIDNGILEELPPVQVQDTQGTWRREAAYPPADTSPVQLHLGRGALTPTSAPLDPPLHLRENEEAWLSANGPADVPTQDSPPYADRLTFDSEPLASTLHLSGWPTLAFAAEMGDITEQKREVDAHFAAILYDVAPDGKAKWVNRGYLSARHRLGVEHPTTILAGSPYEFTVRFFPQETVVEAGHTLRLALSGGDNWAQIEGSLWSAQLTQGTLTLPAIHRDWDAVRLDAPLGDPIKQ